MHLLNNLKHKKMIDKETGRQYVTDENDVLVFSYKGEKIIEYTPKKFKDIYNELKETIEKYIGMSTHRFNCKFGCGLPSKEFEFFSNFPDCYEDSNLNGRNYVDMRCFWKRNSEWFTLPLTLFTGEESVSDVAKKYVKNALDGINGKINDLSKKRDSLLETLKKNTIIAE